MGYLTTSTLLVREAEAEYGAEGADRPDADHQGADRANSSPPPLDDAALDELGHEIFVLSTHIEAATYRLLEMIARFDEGRGWHRAGFRSCAEWLAHRTGIDMGAARERVRAARALRELPLTSQALARGELTFSKVRALTRVAEPETEAHFLELAQGCTAAQVESMVRGWKLGSLKEEADREEWRFRNRSFSVFPDLDGSYVVKGRLTPEVGALLMRAVEMASDHLYRKETAEEEGYTSSARGFENEAQAEGRKARDTEAAAARRRADALALLVERGMTVGLGGDPEAEELTTPRGDENGVANVSAETRSRTRGGHEEPRATPTSSGSSAERYQVLVHVDMATLKELTPRERLMKLSGKRARKMRLDYIIEEARAKGLVREEGENAGPSAPCGCRDHSHIEDIRVSAETSRRLTCDASVVPVVRGNAELGGPTPATPTLNLGRRTRTVSAPLRRALEVRDRGCRFPGCGSRFTDAHHVRHWADGGETSLLNCILLCRHHHRLVHEGGWRVDLIDGNRAVFFDPRGGTHFQGRSRPPALGSDPVADLKADNIRKLAGG